MTQPPSDAEKFLYVNTNKLLFYIPSILSSSSLLSGFVFFSLSHWTLYWYFAYALLLIVYLGLSFSVGIFSEPFNFMSYQHMPKSWRPSADIFLPSCGEDLEVIKNTITHAIAMAKYYGDAKVHVLDDAGVPMLRIFCSDVGVNYIARETKELKKAGNIRNAFKLTKGEVILILDADFVARPEMLEEMVSRMEAWVAIVQTPQFFRVNRNMPWIEKGAGFVQELFYRLIQVNRDHFAAPVCVGTCALYRRQALEPFGGTAPIDYSEDLHTGFLVMTHNWQVKYFPINLAAGECPNNLQSYFTQQYRWCMGSITLMTNPEFWKAKAIGFIQRCCFLTGMLYYIATATSIIMTVVPSLIVLWFFPHHAHWYSIMFSLPSLLVGTCVIALWSKHPFGLYAVEARIVAYWAHLFAIVDKARGNLMPWVPTGAVARVSRFTWFQYSFLAYSVLLSGLLIAGAIKNRHNIEILPMVLLSGFYRVLDLKIVIQSFMGASRSSFRLMPQSQLK